MAILSRLQQAKYLDLIDQASLRPNTRKALINGIEHPESIEMLNDYCSRATKIDIAIFQAITNPGPDPKDIKITSLTQENERYKEALQTTETLEKDKNDCNDRATTAKDEVEDLKEKLESLLIAYESLKRKLEDCQENNIQYVGNSYDDQQY